MHWITTLVRIREKLELFNLKWESKRAKQKLYQQSEGELYAMIELCNGHQPRTLFHSKAFKVGIESAVKRHYRILDKISNKV
jgi:hypothetical protein